MTKRIIVIKGGPGSGNHGHGGRPGKVGGSTPSGGGRSIAGAGPNPSSTADIRRSNKTSDELYESYGPETLDISYGDMRRPDAVFVKVATESGLKTIGVSQSDIMESADGNIHVKWDAFVREVT